MPAFSDPESKRLWLRKEAPFSLALLLDEIICPFAGYQPLPSFHRDQCRLLDLDLRYQRNTINIWSRGLWKTATITIGQTIQRILQNPETSILIRHFDEDIAKSFLTGGTTPGILDHFTKNPYMRYVFPEFCPEPGEKCSTATSFTVPDRARRRKGMTRPSVFVAGLNSTVIGMHFDHIHDDDVETPKSVGREVSPAVREKHWSKWLDWTQLAERPIRGKRRGTYSGVGTYWHYDGILKRAEERKNEFKIQFRIHPAWNQKTNTLLCPEAYPQATLDRDRAALDAYEFNCAILCTPLDDERAAFKITDDLWWTLPPTDYKKSLRLMGVDPAYTTDRRNDYTGVVVVDILPDDTWVVIGCYALRLEPYSLIQELYDLQRQHRAQTIYLEAISSGQILLKWIRHEADRLKEKLPIQEVKKQTKANALKEKVRIRRLSPRVEAGKLRLWKQAPGIGYLLEEMRQWPIGKDEHLLDALATMAELAPRGKALEGEERPALMEAGSVGWWMNEIASREEQERQKIGAWRDRPRWSIQRREYR